MSDKDNILELPEEPKRPESLWEKIWRLTESNFFWGGGVGVALAAYAFVGGAPKFSVVLLVIAWLIITVSIYRHNFFESRSKLVQIASQTLIATVLAILLAVLWLYLRPTTTPELHGMLIPANEKINPNRCVDDPENVLALYLGSSLAWTKEKQVGIKIRGQELLTISRGEGGINISARVISVDNQVIAQITNNELYINPNDYFQAKRPNWHTLIIEDRNGNQVLNVYYANPSTVKVLGRFYNQGRRPVTVTEDVIRVSPLAIRNGCYNGKTVIDIE